MDWTGYGGSVEQVGRPRFRAFDSRRESVSTGDWGKTRPLGTENGFDLRGYRGQQAGRFGPGWACFERIGFRSWANSGIFGGVD